MSLLCYTEAKSSCLTGQRAKVIAFPHGDAIPLNITLAADCLGPVQIPRPGNTGPAAAVEFIGEDVSACGFGGRDVAPVVLALRKL